MRSRFPYGLKDLYLPLALVLFPALLIMKQPDLGTALLLLLVAFSIILFLGVEWKLLVISLGGLLGAFPFLWYFLKDYQKKRILIFIQPEADPLGAGYHILQSKIAVGSGAFLGKGFMKGTQGQLRFLPEQHTDFAFSVLAEEWGFIGAFFVLTLYLVPAALGFEHRPPGQGPVWPDPGPGGNGHFFLAGGD